MNKDEKTEMRKNITQFKKLFSYLPEIKEDNIIPNHKLVGYMDRFNVCMIIPKTYYLKTIINQDFDVKETNIPELKYDDVKTGGYYSNDFLTILLPILKNSTGQGFSIKTGENFPMTIETKEVKIIIAPRNDHGEFQ